MISLTKFWEPALSTKNLSDEVASLLKKSPIDRFAQLIWQVVNFVKFPWYLTGADRRSWISLSVVYLWLQTSLELHVYVRMLVSKHLEALYILEYTCLYFFNTNRRKKWQANQISLCISLDHSFALLHYKFNSDLFVTL